MTAGAAAGAAASRLIPSAGAPRRARASPVPPGGGGDAKGLTGQVTNPRAAQLPRAGGAGPPASKAGGGRQGGVGGGAPSTRGPAAGRLRLRADGVVLLRPHLSGRVPVGWRYLLALWKGCRCATHSCRGLCQKNRCSSKAWVSGELAHRGFSLLIFVINCLCVIHQICPPPGRASLPITQLPLYCRDSNMALKQTRRNSPLQHQRRRNPTLYSYRCLKR